MAALVAGCGGNSGGSSAQSPPPTVVAPTTPTPTHSHTHPASSPATSPTATVTVTTPPPVTRCFSIHLALALGVSQGTAGTTYQTIVFTNNGTVPCTLYAYPGVSFVNAGGALIGKPSSEDPDKKKTVTLAVGGQANALLRQPNPGNFPASACHRTTADRLRVYPPGETVPLFVHDPVQVCSTSAGRTGIGTMQAGNGG
jgi:hypothetical protein